MLTSKYPEDATPAVTLSSSYLLLCDKPLQILVAKNTYLLCSQLSTWTGLSAEDLSLLHTVQLGSLTKPGESTSKMAQMAYSHNSQVGGLLPKISARAVAGSLSSSPHGPRHCYLTSSQAGWVPRVTI